MVRKHKAMANCLITGVAGFIGSSLAEKLVNEGYLVKGVDCFTDYYPRKIKEENLAGLRKKNKFEFIEADLNKIKLNELIKNVDVIFHQAAQAGVRSSWGKQFSIYTDNNILVTQKLLEEAKKTDLKKFIYASSSSVYGDSKRLPLHEDDLTTPISPYGVSKLAGEQLCQLYWKNFNVPTISLRYFTVYGPRQRPDMAFNRFIRAILKEEEIIIYGDGEQTRDFTYISDAVDANIRAMKSEKSGVVLNIGGGSRVTLKKCVEEIEKVCDKKAKIKNEEECKGDMRHTFADTEKAKEILGYTPNVNLEEGLKKEVEWVKHMERRKLWE